MAPVVSPIAPAFEVRDTCWPAALSAPVRLKPRSWAKVKPVDCDRDVVPTVTSPILAILLSALVRVTPSPAAPVSVAAWMTPWPVWVMAPRVVSFSVPLVETGPLIDRSGLLVFSDRLPFVTVKAPSAARALFPLKSAPVAAEPVRVEAKIEPPDPSILAFFEVRDTT